MSGSRSDTPCRTSAVALALLLCLLPTLAGAWEASGHLKGLAIATQAPPLPFGESGYIALCGQRLALEHDLPRQLHFEVAIDNQLLYLDPPTLGSLPDPPPGRLVDLERSWGRGRHVSDQLQFDRLLLRGRHGPLDWSLGRQAIGFGRIALASPLDVINPFPPDTLDSDVRPGVDALRATYSFATGGQAGATAVFDDQTDGSSGLLSYADTFRDLDLLLLTGSLHSRPLLGLGAAGNLGLLGVKIESSLYRGRDVGRPGGDLHSSFCQVALELWYRFDNGLVLLVEGLYNGVGSNDPLRYPLVAISAPLREGLSSLLGKRYLLLAPSWEVHPLLTLSALTIWNLGDDSALLRPQLAVSLADNASLDLFYTATVGARPRPGLPLPRSEFGSAGDSGGLLLRWYF